MARHFQLTTGLASVLLLGTMATHSSAAVLVNDQFIDGGVSNGADIADASWYPVVNANNPTIIADGVTGPNEGGNDNALNATTSNTFAGIAGGFTPTTLAVGETMKLSFDFRFINTPTANGLGVRFGLYNSNGGTTGTGNSTNDYGYLVRAQSSSGSSSTPWLGKELGTSAQIFGGEDILTLAKYSTTAAGPGTSSINYSFSITRTSLTENTLSLAIGDTVFTTVTEGSTNDNGNRARLASAAAGTEPSSGGAAYFTFDQIVIGTGNVTSNRDFRIDNVSLVTVVPEPTSLALLGLGAMTLRRRRR